MRVSDIAEIANLSTPEKILLVEDLWDTIAAEVSEMPIPRSHAEELERRLERHRANPGNLLSLEELQARIEQRE